MIIRLIFKQVRLIARLWNALVFRVRHLDGHVRRGSGLCLNVPLCCEGTGYVSLGNDITIGYGLSPMLGDGMVRLKARGGEARILVGDGTAISNNTQVYAEQSITIGARCLIGDGVLIFDSDFHDLSAEGRHHRPPATAAVVLEDNVFVGSRAIILKGVTIGKDSVIGAGSVVVRSIPPGVIAAGNPAKVIRTL
jgi:maltose O-acetyltransferase